MLLICWAAGFAFAASASATVESFRFTAKMSGPYETHFVTVHNRDANCPGSGDWETWTETTNYAFELTGQARFRVTKNSFKELGFDAPQVTRSGSSNDNQVVWADRGFCDGSQASFQRCTAATAPSQTNLELGVSNGTVKLWWKAPTYQYDGQALGPNTGWPDGCAKRASKDTNGYFMFRPLEEWLFFRFGDSFSVEHVLGFPKDAPVRWRIRGLRTLKVGDEAHETYNGDYTRPGFETCSGLSEYASCKQVLHRDLTLAVNRLSNS